MSRKIGQLKLGRKQGLWETETNIMWDPTLDGNQIWAKTSMETELQHN